MISLAERAHRCLSANGSDIVRLVAGTGALLFSLLLIAGAVAPSTLAFAFPGVGATERKRAQPLPAVRMLPRLAYDDVPPEPRDAHSALRARALNAQTPLVAKVLTPAPPFILRAGADHRWRAIECLASAAVFEAGGDLSEQSAVMQVVVNRVRHPAFPASICGVVFQGAERPTGCQFTFTCDGSMLRRRPSARSWNQARRLASDILLGHVDPRVGLATHYHTDWVTPSWSRMMDKVAVTPGHLFFQWRGKVGRPGAFKDRYAGSEAFIAQLTDFSSAHASIVSDIPIPQMPVRTAEKSVTLSTANVGAGTLPDRAGSPPSNTILALLPSSDPDSFLDVARRACGRRVDCKYVGWTDPVRKAARWPIIGIEIDAIAFSYLRNGDGSSEQTQWDCRRFRRPETTQCLLRGSTLPNSG